MQWRPEECIPEVTCTFFLKIEVFGGENLYFKKGFKK